MNSFPRQMLRRIVVKYGKEIGGDARRCENLLKDLCGSYTREINVLVNAVEEQIPLDLLNSSRSMPLELLLTRLEKRLEQQTALTEDAARWAVESWAFAFDLISEKEIEARRKQIESAPPAAKTKNVEPDRTAARETGNEAANNSAQLPKKPTVIQPQRVNPPLQRQMPSPNTFPPVALPKNNPQINQPVQVPTINNPSASRKGFGLLRGCLLVIFLVSIASIVLFFGVPYAIEVMRETQRERNQESPRFPSR